MSGRINVITGHALPAHKVSYFLLAERRVTFHEAGVVKWIEGDECEDEMLPPNNVSGNLLPSKAGVEDYLGLRDIPLSAAIKMQSTFRGSLSNIQEKCLLVGNTYL